LDRKQSGGDTASLAYLIGTERLSRLPMRANRPARIGLARLHRMLGGAEARATAAGAAVRSLDYRTRPDEAA
jgi:hypothetical protein